MNRGGLFATAFAFALAPWAARADTTSVFLNALTSEQAYYTAIHYQETGRTAEAIKLYTDSVRKDGTGRWQKKSYYALSQIYLGKGSFHDMGKGIDALEQAALIGDGKAAGDLADLETQKHITPPHLKELIPVYEGFARQSSNTIAILLAQLTEDGKLGAKPAVSAIGWYTIAADRGSNTAIHKLVFVYAAEGNDAKALAMIKRMKKDDVASVYLDLAKDFLADGGDLKKNSDQAIAWYRRGLATDPEKAVHSATQFYDNGSPADQQAILAAVRPIADDGNPDAALFVAKTIEKSGTGLTDDAVRYYAIAAKGGNGDAVTGLVKASAFLKSADPLTQSVLDGLNAAASGGTVDAMLALANLYQVGTLIPRDPAQSFAWYLKAAKAGSAEAEFRAGIAYAQGQGTGTDVHEARRWLTAADQQGYPLAAPSLQALGTAD